MSDLLALIRSRRATTRNALMLETGLSRSTVLQRVSDMVTSGLVLEETADSPVGVGRPPSMLAFNDRLGVLLALDLGASHCRVAVTDLGGTPLVEEEIRFSVGREARDIAGVVLGGCHESLQTARVGVDDVLAIGVGIPGRVHSQDGRSVAIMPGWNGEPLADALSAAFGAPVLVENDVKVMALGEHRASGGELDPLLFVKLATGVGAGLVIDGSSYRGLRGAAGHIGHLTMSPDSDILCPCGNRGCLTALVSGPAIAGQLSAAGLEAGTTADVVKWVDAGNHQAFETVRQAGRVLGEALAVFVSMVAPHVIVIGGELAEAREPLLAGIRETVYLRSLPIATGDLQVVPSRLGPRAGIVGAIAMAVEHVASPDGLTRLIAERTLR